jgi:hypothetical protein
MLVFVYILSKGYWNVHAEDLMSIQCNLVHDYISLTIALPHVFYTIDNVKK